MNEELVPYFTIFTPVYNGAKTIHRVFDSIKKQTYKDFEWIIVNDGSTDETAELIASFCKDNRDVKIVYIEQHNSGKHIAWNKAVSLAKGKLFIPADADDSFNENTLDFFRTKWESFNEIQKSNLSGINVLCYYDSTNNYVGEKFPKDGFLTNNLELSYKCNILGEKWGCIRTELLKQTPFPIVVNSFYPESYLWFTLSKKYKVVCFNTALRNYYRTENGLTQGLSLNSTNQVRVNIRHNYWLMVNFGSYILVNSPRKFLRLIFGTIYYIFILIKRKVMAL